MISFSTITGLLMAMAMLAGAVMMSTDNYMLFVSLTSLLIVLGGTFTAALMSFSYPMLVAAILAFLRNFKDEANKKRSTHAQITRILEWNNIYRSGGMTALESSLTPKETKDDFIQLGIEMMGSGYKGQDLKQMLMESNESQKIKDDRLGDVLSTMGNYAPGFGMVGTLLGLIIMLDNLNGDMTQLGQGLAVALLTTLYGILLAQLLFRPAATRIYRRVESEYEVRQLFVHAFVFITEKRPDIYLQDNLNGYLSSKDRLV